MTPIGQREFAICSGCNGVSSTSAARIRQTAQIDRFKADAALRAEQQRITDVRMALIPPHRRPQYPSTERMAILELKAARGWSLEQTARAFFVTAATIASWMRRLDEEGPDALVQLRQPVNKFPDFVRYVVQRLKRLCPTMGKLKIAESLARAGLHLGSTSVGRMLKEKCRGFQPPLDEIDETATNRIVTAKYPGHVWHVDLTTVPTSLGFWCPWLPFALPQSWPFCWWVAAVVDHFSRRMMGVTAFKSQPSSEAMRAFLGRAIAKSKHHSPRPLGEGPGVRARGRERSETFPKYIVCDRGKQFDCSGFRAWCKRKGIKPPRYGAVGKSGSIAVVERFILTMKTLLSCLVLVPYRHDKFQQELSAIANWYNTCRPHTWLGGKTPDEVYHERHPANRKPRFEPRSRWPRGSPCAKPWALVRGSPGAKLTLEVSYYADRKHLPVVILKRAA